MNDKTLLPTELEISPAGRWKRLLAKLVDAFIFMIPVLCLFVVMFFGSASDFNSESGYFGLVTGTFFASIFFGVSIFILNLELLCQNGQTIGKSLFAIKIVRLDGSRAGLLRIIFLRFLPIGILNSIPFVALLDPLLIFQKSRRCLHDLIANTIVIDTSDNGSSRRITVVDLIKTFVFICIPCGILGVIATPTMTSDIKKSKVAEAMILLNGAKIEVSTYIDEYGKFPSTLGESVVTSGTYVASIELNSQKSYIQATMKEVYNSPVISGKTLRLIYVAELNTWICSTDFWGGINEKSLPKTCRKERRLDFAQKMLQAGMDINTIATMTDLSPEAIQSLSD
jgi:uncharacterized RDD family membrane protein YckC/type II secretory pathway pseudopilin PulG